MGEPCQFSYGVHDCESDDARRYEAPDGGEVWLCIQHRNWVTALGLRPTRESDESGVTSVQNEGTP